MVTVHTGAETIQGRKLFKGGNYMRKYGICRRFKADLNRHLNFNFLVKIILAYKIGWGE